MNITRTIDQNVTILSISGSLMGQPETHILFEHVSQILDEGQIRIEIDLQDVNWINSLGIGSIMKCLSLTNDKQGQLYLSGLNQKIKGIFNKTQLSKVFVIEKSRATAINKLKSIDS